MEGITRYVAVSDIHGHYDKLITALEGVNFNKETDTIISVGDAFDRGPDSYEVLRFLMSCPHRILIWGNHDYTLYMLLRGLYEVDPVDITNGVPETLKSFTGLSTALGLPMMLQLFSTAPEYEETRNLLANYFAECVWALEFKNRIVTHAWLPNDTITVPGFATGKPVKQYFLRDDWRDNSNVDDWINAIWTPSLYAWAWEALPEKTLIIGHWKAMDFHEMMGRKVMDTEKWEDNTTIDSHTFIDDKEKLIVLDGCAAWSRGGQVNAYVFETYDWDIPEAYWTEDVTPTMYLDENNEPMRPF